MTTVLQDRLFRCVALVPVSLAALALAQSAAPDPDALSGPKVVDRAAKSAEPTLMQPSFDGSQEQLTQRPEVALLRQLDLSPAEKAGTDALLAERSLKVHRLLNDNLDEFIELQGLLQEVAGGSSAYAPRTDRMNDDDGDEAPKPAKQDPPRVLLREKLLALREKAIDLVDPPLVDQLAEHLSKTNQSALRDAVADYYKANPAPGPASIGASSPPRPDQAANRNGDASRSSAPRGFAARRERQRIEVQQLLREMGRSFAAIVEERQSRFEELVQAVQPTPEQESKIQAILRDQGISGQLKPTPAQRAESFRKIMALLTAEQRKQLREAIAK
jgi:hypothetical protein